MKQLERDHAFKAWREQELASFGRRAHRQLGRGFVLFDREEERPIYVTRIGGAPQPLIEAVLEYDPEREALLVTDEECQDGSFTITCVAIERRH